ncbi:MAG: hypothetical protein HOV94_20165 [Saccharothrix sp.]|nr:hypothetical protein [Saccharothrix sp.]
MSVEAVIALVTLAVGLPQGVVAVRQLRSDATRREGRPSPRGVALALSSAVFLGIGLVFGIALASGPDREPGTASAQSTTASDRTTTTTSATSTTITTTTNTASAEPGPAVADLAMTVPPPGCGSSAGVDVHLDAPERSVPGEQESPEADLEYDDCDGNVYPGSHGSAGLFTAGPKPTREECRGAALRNSIGEYRSIHTMAVGTVLCVVTDEDNVVAATITALGAPWADGPDDGPRQPTIALSLTRWSS